MPVTPPPPPPPPRPESLEALPTGEALPISPSLVLMNEAATPEPVTLVDASVLLICGVALVLGIVAAFVAQFLLLLIAGVTNLAFFQRFSIAEVSPAENQLGLWAIAVPIIGALFVGLMARYGSKAIRGHGIPEAM